MKRGEIYRTKQRVAERGDKPGFYLIVSRTFIAENDDVATVICAPIYGRVLGLATEVEIGPSDGLPRPSAIRCDFLTLMFKERLTHYVSVLPPSRLAQLDLALAQALGLDVVPGKLARK